ncbi:MAG: hypothetical protein KKD09_09590 [Gammaproteobacteria bacterium]|nr:hypothetical protein [Gammaproteobacteria bacterium]MBU4080695.1 hypothetical protein [Gammaproteobacteria bacterium]MBU4113515.1 hypothetical protein [Gammaproteobacteria bacterium]
MDTITLKLRSARAVKRVNGKGTRELGLVHGLLKGFRARDVMLADALYFNYSLN